MIRGLEKVAVDRRHLVAQQVRCSTGYTVGHVVDGVARLRPLGVTERVAHRAVRAPDAEAGPAYTLLMTDLPGRLLAALRRWSRDQFLPAPGELAAAAGFANGVDDGLARQRLSQAFNALARERVLVTIAGTPDAWRGQRMVLLLDDKRVLRTQDAPAFWLPRLRELADG
jgi:hypothetical protein